MAGTPRIEVVALGAMGVIDPVADDRRDLLILYLRSKDCGISDEAIIEAPTTAKGLQRGHSVHR